MKIKGVIVDLDGTLTEFNLAYMEVRQQILKDLDGLSLLTEELMKEPSVYQMLKQLKGNVKDETFIRLRKRFYDLLEDMEVRAAREVLLQSGVPETLHDLKSRPLKMGIVTNNSRAGTRLTLQRYRLEHLFDSVVTRDDCDEMKPDIGPVLRALKDIQVHRRDVLMVGDGTVDVMAAKAVGITSVAVGAGHFKTLITRVEPDYIIGSFKYLPELLGVLENGTSINSR